LLKGIGEVDNTLINDRPVGPAYLWPRVKRSRTRERETLGLHAFHESAPLAGRQNTTTNWGVGHQHQISVVRQGGLVRFFLPDLRLAPRLGRAVSRQAHRMKRKWGQVRPHST
jgi:hypothetical protein